MPSDSRQVRDRWGNVQPASEEELAETYEDDPYYTHSQPGQALDTYYSRYDQAGQQVDPTQPQTGTVYRRSGESTRDLSAGGGSGNPFGMSDEEWGLLDGGAKAQYRAAQQEAERNREILHNLGRMAPSVDDLSTQYAYEGSGDEYGDLLGGRSELAGIGASGEQNAAMQALQGLYQGGGFTEGDRQARRLAAMERGQQLRGANEAALQQMSARGMSGSGAELAARLGASQALSQGQAMNDAAVHQAAMQRQFAALQAYQAGANTMQDQDLARRSALDAFNQSNLDWRRGRETRNTAWENQSRESRSNAYQTNYQNAQNRASLHLGHNPNTASQAGKDSAEANRGVLDKALAFTGSAISGIF